MIKKITTFALGLLLTAGLWAQTGNNDLHRHTSTGDAKTITFPASDIQFWTGTGTNQAIIILAWDDDPGNNNIALAWGVRWNGSATATDLLDTIVAYDSRFSYTVSGSLMTNMSYNDGTINPSSSMNGWCYYLNGDWAMYAWPNQPMTNGDVIEMSSSCSWTMTSAVAATNPSYTPTDATISASEIEYWVGEGPFDIIFTINWPDTALAWGYHFSARSTNLQSVMNDIAEADNRLVFEYGTYGIDDILFIENGDTLRKAAYSWWEHTVNGSMSAGLYQQLNNGDFSRWADPTAGVVVDSTYDSVWNYWMYTYAYPQTIYPVSAPTPTDATISAEDILYWVGEGDNSLIFVVNWPDSALAWGYRFSASNIDLQSVMNDIADADSRLMFVNGDWGIDDILFIENGDTLRKAEYSWWEHTVNGSMSAGVYQQMNNGDFSRWADPTAGVVVDSTYDSDWNYWMYTYAYPQVIHPVSRPNSDPEVGPFCGAVGTEGCTAVKFDDPSIQGWATSCTVVRGSSNLSDPEATPVTFGTEDDAVGPATANTMDVVSLGDGGNATLTFATPIANGDGYDFAVFENSFNDYFLELAVVEVSSDGEHFVRFPATSLTQTHTQITERVDPTFINNLAGKYRVGYGTPFDLEDLRDSTNIDINNITHIRVIDVVGSIDPQYGTYDAFGHLINDPFPTITYSAGFDLDGVAVMNTAVGIDELKTTTLRLYPNPANTSVSLTFEALPTRCLTTLYDMAGRKVASYPVEAGATTLHISTATLSDGVYMLSLLGNIEKLVVRH
ncbi:MAG: T9SS type A sorting domain-containing protein [Bacteroidales bacterium]|nr:T9SS type A sorting domain-containing protein [Bacteroidales bacterium]